MKIGVDLRPLYTGSKYRGVGFYTRETLKELLKLDTENEYHFLNLYGDFPDDIELDSRCYVHTYYEGPMVADCGEKNLFRTPELDEVREAQVRHFLKHSGIDVMLFTSPNEYGNPFKAKWFSDVRTATIMYDVIPLAFPDQCLFDPRYKADYEASLDFVKGLDLLLAISEFTGEDVAKRLNIPGEKIKVVSSGIDARYLNTGKRNTRQTRRRLGIESDYFLFAGGIDFKKNIESIIEAYSKLRGDRRDKTSLVIVGKAAEDTINHYRQIAEEHDVVDRLVFTGFVTDDELIDLYCDARALVFPSLYEGFGLPVIEAMACGTPVITSNTSSLKEIAEGYALMVNPKRVREITQAMETVLDGDPRIAEMAQKAKEHAGTYTWSNVAGKVFAALKQLSLTDKGSPAYQEPEFRVSDGILNDIANEYCAWDLPFGISEADRIGRELQALENDAPLPVLPCGKRVLYDFTVVSDWMKNNYVTGIGRVAVQLYYGLRKFAQVVPVCSRDEDGQFAFYRLDMGKWEPTSRRVPVRSGDIYFMPEYQVRGVQLPEDYPRVDSLRQKGVRTYAMLYDILPLLMPQYFEKKTVTEFKGYLADMLADYDGIITDSRTVADEMLAYVSGHPEVHSNRSIKAGFIHLGGNSVSERKSNDPVPGEVVDFFKGTTYLMVGTVEPRKGHACALSQFEKLWEKGTDVKLCIIGHAGWNMNDFIQGMRAHREHGKRLLFIEAASDSVLNYAYEHATALIQASAGEGFGLPLIEAGEYDLPVICSDIPVFHEVAGEHATYFNRDSDELSRIVEAFDPRKAPISKDIESWSWERAACAVANMLIDESGWYKRLKADGTSELFEEKENRFTLIPEETTGDGQTRRSGRRDSGEKSILIIYPNNFVKGGQGTNNRIRGLMQQLKSRGWSIDQLGFDHFSQDTDFESFKRDNSEGLVRNLYLYDFADDRDKASRNKRRIPENRYLQDWTRPGMHEMLNDIARKNNYTAIATFYTYLANLFATLRADAKKVYFMEDCMFLQQTSWGLQEGVTMGNVLDEDVEKVKLFDEVFCISYDEKIMYEKLTGKPMRFLPHLMSKDTRIVTTPVENRKWDAAFVGFNNPFNVEGLHWFVDEVCPYLDPDIRVVFVGSMTRELKHVPACADVIPFAPSLEDLFDDVKINICPMFRGTGMKIKVVEAMARGLPTVCNDRGVDGFPDKLQTGCLVTQDAREFAGYINRLSKDRKFYDEKTEQTRRYYRELFDVEKYGEMLDKLLG